MSFIEISGKVKKGKKLSKDLGFPTINIPVPRSIAKKNWGIYFSLVKIDGRIYPGVTHLGKPKTFQIAHNTCETYLLNFNKDLYGKNVSKKLIFKLRDIIKFPSVKELKKEMAKDVKAAKKFFGM